MRNFSAMVALSLFVCPAVSQQFSFRDVGKETGLLPDVFGIAGHGVIWGDVDGDGWPDLYVGTFGSAPYGSKNNLFFRNNKGKFTLDAQQNLRIAGRGNGGVFADFDNDGDLDLYVTNHAIDWKPFGKGNEHFSAPNALFRNDGAGKFTDVSKGSGACPEGFAARSACAVDYDGDGLVDLVVGECYFQGGQSRSKLFRNLGNFKFENVTTKVGLPEKVTGFGVIAGDFNNDGWPDLFLAGREGGNKLFLNDRKGNFKEVPKSHADFNWKYPASLDDTSCGACMGDVNRDGLLDIVIGHHYSQPWTEKEGGVPVRLYLNRGLDNGIPRFEDVTEKVGLKPLPMKAPHVEIQDFDNDGWPDLYVCIVKFAAGKTYPVIFKNHGVKDGLPRFTEDALAVNDFPTAADIKLPGAGEFFDKLKKEGKIIYMAPGASCDFDRDGKLDVFLANWFVDRPSLLLKNETKSGHWLQVELATKGNGIGARVNAYEAGKIGQKGSLLQSVEIAVGYGYASGQEAVAHLGLGAATTCDLEILLPHGKGKIEQKGVKVDQRLKVKP